MALAGTEACLILCSVSCIVQYSIYCGIISQNNIVCFWQILCATVSASSEVKALEQHKAIMIIEGPSGEPAKKYTLSIEILLESMTQPVQVRVRGVMYPLE